MGEALEDTLNALREALAKRPEVLEAYLCGSTARGEQQAHSDVDVAVYVDRDAAPPTPFGYRADLITELMRALRTNRAGVVVLNNAPPLLYYQALRDGIRICSRDLMASTRREGQALSRYCDFVPQLAKIDAAHHARIMRGDFGR